MWQWHTKDNSVVPVSTKEAPSFTAVCVSFFEERDLSLEGDSWGTYLGIVQWSFSLGRKEDCFSESYRDIKMGRIFQQIPGPAILFRKNAGERDTHKEITCPL